MALAPDVEQGEAQVVGHRPHRRQLVARLEAQLDPVLLGPRLEQPGDLVEARVHVVEPGGRGAAANAAEQALDDAAAALGVDHDLLEQLAHPRGVGRVPLRRARRQDHGSQRIVDLVGHAARERADGGEPVRAPHRELGALAIGDVLVRDHRVGRPSVREAGHPQGEPAFLARAVAGVLEPEATAPALQHLADAGCGSLGLRRVAPRGAIAHLEVALAHPGPARGHAVVAREGLPRRVDGHDGARAVEHGDVRLEGVERGAQEAVGIAAFPGPSAGSAVAVGEARLVHVADRSATHVPTGSLRSRAVGPSGAGPRGGALHRRGTAGRLRRGPAPPGRRRAARDRRDPARRRGRRAPPRRPRRRARPPRGS